jgi:hypothetical protein
MVKPFPSKTHMGNHALHPETLMLNYGYDPQLSEGAVKPPVFLTSMQKAVGIPARSDFDSPKVAIHLDESSRDRRMETGARRPRYRHVTDPRRTFALAMGERYRGQPLVHFTGLPDENRERGFRSRHRRH